MNEIYLAYKLLPFLFVQQVWIRRCAGPRCKVLVNWKQLHKCSLLNCCTPASCKMGLGLRIQLQIFISWLRQL